MATKVSVHKVPIHHSQNCARFCLCLTVSRQQEYLWIINHLIALNPFPLHNTFMATKVGVHKQTTHYGQNWSRFCLCLIVLWQQGCSETVSWCQHHSHGGVPLLCRPPSLPSRCTQCRRKCQQLLLRSSTEKHTNKIIIKKIMSVFFITISFLLVRPLFLVKRQ